jgi:hypothetical protein
MPADGIFKARAAAAVALQLMLGATARPLGVFVAECHPKRFDIRGEPGDF